MQASSGRTVLAQGRIVWVSGDLFKGKPRLDQQTKAQKFNKQGEPMMEYGFGLAVPKSALGQTAKGQPGEIWAALYEEAYTLYPSRQIPPGFAMKYKDGDGIDHNGVSFKQREGHAGHIIFACTTSIPIKFFKFENGVNVMINEGIKCGDYVNVQLQIKAHPAVGTAKPGLYLNPYAVQFLGYGKEIVNAPGGDTIFGTAAPAMPAGASAVPIAPQAGAFAPQPSPMQQAMYPGTPVTPGLAQAPTYQPPQAIVQPHHAVLPQQFQPPPTQYQQGGQPTAMPSAAPAMPQFQPQPTGMPVIPQ